MMPVRSPVHLLLLTVGLLVGCNGGEKADSNDGDSIEDQATDRDGDGVSVADGDCNDANPSVSPNADERCNGADDNCDGQIDEGFTDSDADGLADCLDREDCDGRDNNGDGVVDEGFSDGDGDGRADCADGEACDGIDNNGDGRIDEGYDVDGDGYTQCGSDELGADCDDTNPALHPDNEEVGSNGTDDDCDGMIDERAWASGELVITEVMVDPDEVLDADGEWFEIYNPTTETLPLDQLSIVSDVDDESHLLDAPSLTIEPGEFFVLGINGDYSRNGGVSVGYVYDGVVLVNGGDELQLRAGDVLLDAVSWARGDGMPETPGAAMMLDQGRYSSILNDDPGRWCAASATFGVGDKGNPGADNEICQSVDHDGDGFSVLDGDCDDNNATVYPGAYEGDPNRDNDCDGDVEWGPVAVPRVFSSTTYLSCNPIYLDGSTSYDPDGSPLTFAWELSGAPAGSTRTTADIRTPVDASPVFDPDVVGTYVFTLVVNDGAADSRPASVTVDITGRPLNAEPVANAGPDRTTPVTARCSPIAYSTDYTCPPCGDTSFTLSGGATDADNDSMTYSWEVVGTSGGATAVLSALTGATVNVTVGDVPATFGGTSRGSATVQMTAIDCMGARDTDTVDVTVECTGVE